MQLKLKLIGATAMAGQLCNIAVYYRYSHHYHSDYYEGRPINKLQNVIILLNFKLYKIRNIGFVRNLILNNSYEFYYDDVTVTSIFNDKYGDATAKSIP